MSEPETAAPAAPATPPRAGAPLWMRVLLVVSLAVNLLILGTVVGAVLRHAPMRETMMRDAGGPPYLRALDPRDRLALERALREEAGPPRAALSALRADFAEALRLLRTEPFDAAAFAATLERQRGRLADRASTGDRLFVERLAAMSPAERAEIAARIEAGLRRVGRDGR